MAESRSKSRYRRAIAGRGRKKKHKRRQGRPVPALSPARDLSCDEGRGKSSLINPAVCFPLPRCATSETMTFTMVQLWMTMFFPASVLSLSEIVLSSRGKGGGGGRGGGYITVCFFFFFFRLIVSLFLLFTGMIGRSLQIQLRVDLRRYIGILWR